MESRPCILVTGAATGIGRATARLFAGRGWFVGLADIDERGVEALGQELGAESAMPFRLDVTRPEEWGTVLETLHRSRGRLDLLLNNAGILISGPFEAGDLAQHHRLVDVNVKGTLNGCFLAKPYLQATPDARVINLSSMASSYGQAGLATYSTTKFAVRGLTEALNIEWEADRIRVMDVMPLFVRTKLLEGVKLRTIDRLGIGLKPEDVAAVVWKAAHHRGYARVHWTVGPMAALLHGLGGVSPAAVNRLVARFLAT